jgi:hypothetical protein
LGWAGGRSRVRGHGVGAGVVVLHRRRPVVARGEPPGREESGTSAACLLLGGK